MLTRTPQNQISRSFCTYWSSGSRFPHVDVNHPKPSVLIGILVKAQMAEVFEFNAKKIRVFRTQGKVWFIGADVANCLDYSNYGKASLTHVPEGARCFGRTLFASDPSLVMNRYEKQSSMIDSSGVCSLLTSSKMPNKDALIAFLSAKFGFSYSIMTRLGKEQEYVGALMTAFAHCSPIRQFKVGDYSIDLYFPAERLAIECDEFGHSQRNAQDEAVREEYISRTLGCKFIRFNPDEASFSIYAVINRIIVTLMSQPKKSS